MKGNENCGESRDRLMGVTVIQHPEDEWDEMQKRFRDGSIAQAVKEDLQRYLAALALLQVRSEENRQRAKQIGDTLRMLLTAKETAESGRRTRQLARLALYVSAGSFLIAAWVAWFR